MKNLNASAQVRQLDKLAARAQPRRPSLPGAQALCYAARSSYTLT